MKFTDEEIKFTDEEIKFLKELAKERIEAHKIFCCDEDGKEYEYRNKFETWNDAYTNLKHMGQTHEQIIKEIGVKKNENKD